MQEPKDMAEFHFPNVLRNIGAVIIIEDDQFL